MCYRPSLQEELMVVDKNRRIFVQTGFVDMRKQINGLSAYIQEHVPEGPFSGSYFVFCGKTRRVMKIIYWDDSGFCLWLKRLEKDSFPWPRKGDEVCELTREKLKLLLRGIDVWKEHERLVYDHVA
jgi:transposase